MGVVGVDVDTAIGLLLFSKAEVKTLYFGNYYSNRN
jgi:hypothetical protein